MPFYLWLLTTYGIPAELRTVLDKAGVWLKMWLWSDKRRPQGPRVEAAERGMYIKRSTGTQ
jgi:hypothetical protein